MGVVIFKIFKIGDYMEYKINNAEEVPELLSGVKKCLLKHLKDNKMLSADLYKHFPAVEVVFIMFRGGMDLKKCFKLLDLVNYELEPFTQVETDKRLWWFINALAWDSNKEKLRGILKERYVAEEKAKLNTLVTATVESKEKKRI